MPIEEYFKINKNRWDQLTPIHFQSKMYNIPSLIAGKNLLPEIDKKLLKDVNGKSLLHLQCHFGADSIAISRMGADVTGVDLSSKAIETAIDLNATCNTKANFVCSNVYDLADNLHGQFDYIYTSYGTTIWLPDLAKWAAIVDRFLKPGGHFVFVDFHPSFYILNHKEGRFHYHYFNKKEPYEEMVEGTYTDFDANIKTQEFTWSHSLAEHLSPFINKGWHLRHFNEYDYSPYNCFEHMKEIETGKFQYQLTKIVLPHVYSFVFTKPNN